MIANSIITNKGKELIESVKLQDDSIIILRYEISSSRGTLDPTRELGSLSTPWYSVQVKDVSYSNESFFRLDIEVPGNLIFDTYNHLGEIGIVAEYQGEIFLFGLIQPQEGEAIPVYDSLPIKIAYCGDESTVSKSSYFLLPALKEFPLFKDLCYFIDYLGIDIDQVYTDLRNKYVDFEKLSEDAIHQAFTDLGADYIVVILELFRNQNLNQLLGIVSLIQLWKGQLKGVELIGELLGFKFTVEAWWETLPLGIPNTATLDILVEDSGVAVYSEGFLKNFKSFLESYLYPIITLKITISFSRNIYSIGCYFSNPSYVFEEVPVEIEESSYIPIEARTANFIEVNCNVAEEA